MSKLWQNTTEATTRSGPSQFDLHSKPCQHPNHRTPLDCPSRTQTKHLIVWQPHWKDLQNFNFMERQGNAAIKKYDWLSRFLRISQFLLLCIRLHCKLPDGFKLFFSNFVFRGSIFPSFFFFLLPFLCSWFFLWLTQFQNPKQMYSQLWVQWSSPFSSRYEPIPTWTRENQPLFRIPTGRKCCVWSTPQKNVRPLNILLHQDNWTAF